MLLEFYVLFKNVGIGQKWLDFSEGSLEEALLHCWDYRFSDSFSQQLNCCLAARTNNFSSSHQPGYLVTGKVICIDKFCFLFLRYIKRRTLPVVTVNIQDTLSGFKIGRWNVDDFVESPWTQKGCIKSGWPVCSTQHEHTVIHGNIHPVHLVQKSRQHTSLRRFSSSRSVHSIFATEYGVKLIKEDDARSSRTRKCEGSSNNCFGFTKIG
mmetsp:Transcript_31501/g.72467  ORF Transcript_31501/g.72467 Transcript_31501/m.72467 type:complete len:210 (-) Transcript_31501:273-902(-)